MRFLHHFPSEMIRVVLCACIFWGNIGVVQAQVDWKKEWERSLQEAKKEGMIVAGIPARAELRKEIELVFKPKFGIGMDLSTARGRRTPAKSLQSLPPG